MSIVALVGDIVAVVAFGLAMAIVVSIPASAKGVFTPLTKWLMFAAFATRLYVSATKVYVFQAGPSVFEDFGDYIEVLFPVLLMMSVFSAFMTQQLGDLRSSQQAVKASSAMMVDMVDSAPAGILVLDGAGRITFANESARDILDLEDEEGTGGFSTPGWVVRDPSGACANDFSCLLAADFHKPVHLAVEWANGWRVVLDVSARPLDADLGSSGGMVASFERPSAKA